MPQTGATRYQKFLKSEKGKTKLKAKKDLPRGTNVTKTNFKVKKIVIKEQLTKHAETEWLSTRKLNVHELLSRLKHFNTNAKKQALIGIKELVTLHPEVLENNLGQLINGITPLILDVEKIIRRETLQVLNKILTSSSIDKLDPFYDIMSTYLRCAMTNLDYRIQEDSLLFLDILLVSTPQKVAEDFHKVIPTFLNMISKLRMDSTPGRTLTVNMGSEITSVKWRVQVLNRLKDYLNKYVQTEHIVLDCDQDVIYTIEIVDTAKMNSYPLFNSNCTAVCHLSCFSSQKYQESTPLDEVKRFTEYIDTLMPLLLETWVEVCPNTNSEKNFETVVSEDAASLLKHMLEVIQLLWNIVQYLNKKNPSSMIEHLFQSKYRSQYTNFFLKKFPFVTNTRLKQKNYSAQEQVTSDPKLIAENLEICHLFILLNPKINIKSNEQEIMNVLNYIEKTFNQNTEDSINNAVLKILHTIFSKEVNSWNKTVQVMDALLRKIIWAYFNKTMSSSSKQKIFSLLCQIALNDNLSHFHQSDAFDMWLKNLPDILLDSSVNVETISIIHKLSVCNNKTFNAVVQPKLTRIVENLPSLKIIDAVDDTTSYHKLFALLYWIKSWDEDSLNLLEKQLTSGVYKSDHVKYILDTLKLKTVNKI